jgi:F-type H+-transporting ATPase subunit a
MAAEQLPFTELLNYVTAPVVTPAMEAVGLHPHDPAAPISNSVAMQVLVTLILIGLFILLRARLSADNPGGLQHTFEGMLGFIQKQSRDIIGHGWEPFTSFLISLALFLLFCNMLGLFPGFMTPTEHPEVPLGAALVAFVYYNYHGFKHAGAGYIKHFLGPVWWLSWLMLPIEVVSHLARVLSLTVRLYANMFAGEMVLLVFISLIPLFVPIPFLLLHVAVAFIQTYIFVLLTTVYLQGAVAEEH